MHKVVICMQMAQRRVMPWSCRLSPLLFICTSALLMNRHSSVWMHGCVCVPDNLKTWRVAWPGDSVHSYLNLMSTYGLLSHSMIHLYCTTHELLFFFTSVSVSILYYVTISNVPTPINQVKFLVHLLYPTWQIKGLLSLLLSAQIQCISLHLNGNMPADCMLYFHSFFWFKWYDLQSCLSL